MGFQLGTHMVTKSYNHWYGQKFCGISVSRYQSICGGKVILLSCIYLIARGFKTKLDDIRIRFGS